MRLYKLFCHAYGKRWFWFRIFGKGLYIRDSRIIKPLFSERMGLNKNKTLKIKSYKISALGNNYSIWD